MKKSEIELRAAILSWLAVGETGESSKAIAFKMIGQGYSRGFPTHPRDPDDLNRCLKLLEAVPQIRPRLTEMREVSPEWAALVDQWDEIEASFLEEAGPNWSKARSAKRTYDMMRRAYGDWRGSGLHISISTP